MRALQAVRKLIERGKEKEMGGLAGKVTWDGKKNHLKHSVKFLDDAITIDNS